ncbi:MAG: hypothetical protein HZC40_08870 [Chloroflexi bacterium]|nr:hypothetical protein [Chloroflexota bacterium]
MRDSLQHFLILIAYTVIAVALSFPLALNFATAIPGVEGDAPSFVWALGWMQRALELGENPFRTDFVFYPLGGATQLMWAISLIAILALPLQAAFGLIVAHNAMYLIATVLTAYGTFLLAREVLASRIPKPKFAPDRATLPPFQTLLIVQFIAQQRALANLKSKIENQKLIFAAFVAGLVFAFAPLRLGYGLAFLNLFNTQFIPVYVLFLIRATRRAHRRDALIAGLFLGLNAYIDFQIAAFLILFTALYATYVLIAGWREARSKFVGWIVGWLTTGALALAIAAPMLAILANDFALEGGNYIRVFPIKYSADRSYDLLSYIAPHAQSALYANTPLKVIGVNAGANANDTSALSPDRQAFIGYAALALALYATITRWRRARFWFFVALAFALFSLGPSLHVFGRDVGVPLPFLALHEIPIINHIRIPMRYGVIVAFAIAMLVGIAISDFRFQISDWRTARNVSRITHYVSRFTFLLIPIFILLEFAFFPYPIQSFTIPKIYETLARAPGDFTVLEIPTFNWRAAATFEAYQPIHGKRILRAYTNRISPGIAEYFAFRGTPIVMRSLRVLEGAEKAPLDPADIAEDKSVRDEVLRFFDLRYAMVHRDFLKADEARAIDLYLREVLGAQIVDDDGAMISYEFPLFPSHPPELRIDLRENIGQMYAGRGWQFEYPKANWEGQFDFVWTKGAQAEIYLVADEMSLRGANATKQSSSNNVEIALHAERSTALRSLAMTIHAFAETPTRVLVYLNDARVGEIALTNAWQDHRIELPARVLKSGMNRVRLDFGAELHETVGVTAISIQ